MTRPKADSDGWLTDPISRDRAIAKAVVEGLSEIKMLLRGIRSDLDESLGMRQAMREVEDEVRDLRMALATSVGPPRERDLGYIKCLTPMCILPVGHNGGHQPSRKG